MAVVAFSRRSPRGAARARILELGAGSASSRSRRCAPARRDSPGITMTTRYGSRGRTRGERSASRDTPGRLARASARPRHVRARRRLGRLYEVPTRARRRRARADDRAWRHRYVADPDGPMVEQFFELLPTLGLRLRNTEPSSMTSRRRSRRSGCTTSCGRPTVTGSSLTRDCSSLKLDLAILDDDEWRRWSDRLGKCRSVLEPTDFCGAGHATAEPATGFWLRSS